jgi:hypothetical protein
VLLGGMRSSAGEFPADVRGWANGIRAVEL